MGFFDFLYQDPFKIAQRDLRAGQNAGYLIALASSRNIQVQCKVCQKEVSELAAVCPNCGESMPGLRIKCPNCSSYHVTIQAKGFSVAQAAAGAVVVGALGLAAGMIGHKDSRLICLGCNYKWRIEKPKLHSPQYAPTPAKWAKSEQQVVNRWIEEAESSRKSRVCHACHKADGTAVRTFSGQWLCAKCIAKGVPLDDRPRVKKLKKPYTYREDKGRYHCEYCVQIGKYHYNKTLKGIKGHIKEHPVDD